MNQPPSSSNKRTRHRIHGNPFTVRGDIEVPNWSELYGRDAPIAIDIGFGSGNFLLGLAKAHPEWNVLGLEIREHFVNDVLRFAAQAGITNLHAMVANANQHLAPLVDDAAVEFISVNFPDPWFKKRHQKRRVINTSLLDVAAEKLCVGGALHVMTDFQPVAEEALVLLSEHKAFVSPTGDAFLAESTTGIVSEREVTHSKRGEEIYRLRYDRIAVDAA